MTKASDIFCSSIYLKFRRSRVSAIDRLGIYITIQNLVLVTRYFKELYFTIQLTYIYFFHSLIFHLLIFLIISFEKIEHGMTKKRKIEWIPNYSDENNLSPNVCLLSDTATANERLQVPLSLHNFRKYTRARGSGWNADPRVSKTRSISVFQDIETFDLEDFKYNFVNITAFRLVDAEDVGVRGILRDMERYQPSGNTILNKSRVIQVGKKFPCHRESLLLSVEGDVERSSLDVCAICYCTSSDIYSRAIDFYIRRV